MKLNTSWPNEQNLSNKAYSAKKLTNWYTAMFKKLNLKLCMKLQIVLMYYFVSQGSKHSNIIQGYVINGE